MIEMYANSHSHNWQEHLLDFETKLISNRSNKLSVVDHADKNHTIQWYIWRSSECLVVLKQNNNVAKQFQDQQIVEIIDWPL